MIQLHEKADLEAQRGRVKEGTLRLVCEALSELLEAYDTTKLETKPLVVLEPEKDDWRTLLDSENLMWVEYAETQSVGEGTSIHKIVKLYDNDCIEMFFAEAGHDVELDLWVQQFTERDE